MSKQVQPGERVRIIAPYSEVNMHMGIAGTPVVASIEGGRYKHAQFWKDGRPWTTVTLGEGGFREEITPEGTIYWCRPDDGPGDPDPAQVQAELTALLREALDVHGSLVITSLGL